jgi:hypothetical protein
VGKSKGRRPLGRPRHRWKVNVKMVMNKIGVYIGLIDSG